MSLTNRPPGELLVFPTGVNEAWGESGPCRHPLPDESKCRPLFRPDRAAILARLRELREEAHDIEMAGRAKAEGGPSIPAEEVFRELGW